MDCESLFLGEQRFRKILHLPQRRQWNHATTVATHRAAVHVMESMRLARRASADNASRWVLHCYSLPASLQSSLSEQAWRGTCRTLLRPADQQLGHQRHRSAAICLPTSTGVLSLTKHIGGLMGYPCMIASFSAGFSLPGRRVAWVSGGGGHLGEAFDGQFPCHASTGHWEAAAAAPCTRSCSSLPMAHCSRTVRLPIINDNIIPRSQAT